MDRVSIFISSPGDVGEERAIAARVIEQLAPRYAHVFALEPVLWELEAIPATGSFQDGVPSPANSDVFACSTIAATAGCLILRSGEMA